MDIFDIALNYADEICECNIMGLKNVFREYATTKAFEELPD